MRIASLKSVFCKRNVIATGFLFLLGPQAANANEICKFFLDWNSKSGMNKDLIYQSNTAEYGLLLEYRARAGFLSYDFESKIPVDTNTGKYELTLDLEFNGPGIPLSVTLDGAKTEKNSKALTYKVDSGSRKQISEIVTISGESLTLSIHAKTPHGAKLWTVVREAQLCPLE